MSQSQDSTKFSAYYWPAEYHAWISAKQRCFNPKNVSYRNYGGRGITMCDRWINSFRAFFEDVGAKPSFLHSLDRFPDVNGNYEPSNCRWATIDEQATNRRTTILLTAIGKTLSISQWAREIVVSGSSITNWLERNQDKSFEEYVLFKISNPGAVIPMKKRGPRVADDEVYVLDQEGFRARRVELTCEYCSVRFLAAQRFKARFCSNSCSNRYKWRKRKDSQDFIQMLLEAD